MDYKLIIKEIHDMCKYLVGKEKEKEQKKKKEKIYISSTEISEIFEAYRQNINKKSKLTSVGVEAIRQAIKWIGKDNLIAVIVKKSKDKFFMEGKKDSGYIANSRRGMGWFCRKRVRLNDWLEETDVETELDEWRKKSEEFKKRHGL